MTPVHPDLLTVLDAVEVLSPTSYTFQGEIRALVPAAVPGPPALLPMLETELYTRLYTRPVLTGGRAIASAGQREHIAALSAVNTGHGAWEAGWTMGATDENGMTAVVKDGVTFYVAPSGVRPPSSSAQPGELCWVKAPKERTNLMPGYYLAVGDAVPLELPDSSSPLARLYWHLTAPAAVPFIAAVTRALNDLAVPFRAKVLSDPNTYLRADAGVLYLERQDCARLGDVLGAIYHQLNGMLRPQIPLFTQPLGLGVGLAEGPRDGPSFGQHRCRLAAEGLWRAFQHGDRTKEARAQAMASVFREAGLRPEAPFLEPGPQNGPLPHVALAPLFGASGRKAETISDSRDAIQHSSSHMAARYLEAGIRIGQELCRSAYWCAEGRQCNWLGRSFAQPSEPEGPTAPLAAALPPGLFVGSAGVAVFLAQLWALTGDPAYRRTAVGAVARSLRQCCRLPAETITPLSYPDGLVGIAYASMRVRALTGERALDDAINALLSQIHASAAGTISTATRDGLAGAIPALLYVGKAARRPDVSQLAVSLGANLLQQASLPGPADEASCVALALLELYSATGQGEFLEGGRIAFEHEEVEGSPDSSARSSPTSIRPQASLARLRAAILDPTQAKTHAAEAQTAIRRAMGSLETMDNPTSLDPSLWRGVAGLLEVVLTAGHWLEDNDCVAWARARGAALIEACAPRANRPAAATTGRPSPTLMYGTAGIGYHFLRQHDPEGVPPILVIVRQPAGPGDSQPSRPKGEKT